MKKDYKITKEQCEANIKGVCEGCGGKLMPIETVDNGGSATYWIGCEHCSCFRSGVDEKYFKIGRKLVETNQLIPYRIDSDEYQYLERQTTSASHTVAQIALMLAESSPTVVINKLK